MNESNEAFIVTTNNTTKNTTTSTMPLHYDNARHFYGRDIETGDLEEVSIEEDGEQSAVEFWGEPTFANTFPTHL